MPKMNHILILLMLLNASCASILKGTSETILVRSDVPGTKIYLDKTLIGQDQGSVRISKKRLQKVRLHAVKEGCQTTTAEIKTSFDSTSLLGAFLDLGLVSILIVDWGIYGSVREADKLNYVLSPLCP